MCTTLPSSRNTQHREHFGKSQNDHEKNQESFHNRRDGTGAGIILMSQMATPAMAQMMMSVRMNE